jgi:hypothetical protein
MAQTHTDNATQRELDLSAHLDELAREDRARLEDLESLYLPLKEAVEKELGKTARGRKVVEGTRALGEQLEEVASVVSSTEAGKDAQLLLQAPVMRFRERHGEQLFAAQAPHLHLRPPVEAIAQVLHPDVPADTLWVSETRPSGGVVLEPKATLTLDEVDTGGEELGTSGQGLSDPGAMCVMQPYGRREEYPLSPVLGEVVCSAELDGRMFQWGWAMSLWHVPEATFSDAWLGNDFPVPDGFTKYEVIVDYEYLQMGTAWAFLGISVINQDVAILVDNLDGTFMKSAQSVSTMIVPVAGGDKYERSGKTTVTLPFDRASGAAGTVKVMVGADAHCWSSALSGMAMFGTGVVSMKLNEICVRPIS